MADLSSLFVSFVCWIFILSLSSLVFILQRVLQLESNISPWRWLLSILIPVIIVIKGYRSKSLDRSGALVAVWIGFVLTLAHVSFFASLLFFFVSSSKLTRYKEEEKRKLEGDQYREGGKRNWQQVLCNGGVPLELGLLFLLDIGCANDLPINFSANYRASWIGCAVLGALACSNGDTWASEIGPVWNKDNPRLITTWKKVPRGTNGAVSLAGLVASIFGGLFVGFGYFVAIYMFSSTALYAIAPDQTRTMWLGGLAGLTGSLIDSLLGATLQYSGITKNGVVVEKPGPGVKFISGWPVFNNHGVNLVSSILTAIVTPILAKNIFF